MESLVAELYDSLRTHSSNECVVDYSLDTPIHLSKKQILIMASALSKDIKKITNSNRVGIVIPSSAVGVIANLAVLFSGKVPVNLNFASTPDVSTHCLRKARIDLVLTVDKLRRKFPHFPYPSKTICCVEKLKQYKSCKYTLIKNLLINLLPKFISKRILNIPSKTENEEFGVLFTSGSSGNPKGVSLSHENIRSNINGICAMQPFPTESKMLANLPLFHSFGFTVTLWMPLLKSIPIVTVPSPLEINKSITAIEKEKITIVLGTPTFLRGYLRKGSSNKFRSIQFVVAGAEKSNIEFIKQWENLAECNYLEGYGLTETSPVLSLNTTERGIKHGTVGRVLPEVKVKTIHPDTHEDLGRHDSGILCFKAPSVFTHYISDQEKTENAFMNEWFVTGDIGRMDEEGFLVIEGRLSRFSKIGGEMIPHETIEQTALKILKWEINDEVSLVVVGKPHDTKGEELYLITTQSINFDKLRKELSEKLGNLFAPKKHIVVDEIPVLPTGKLNLQELKNLV